MFPEVFWPISIPLFPYHYHQHQQQPTLPPRPSPSFKWCQDKYKCLRLRKWMYGWKGGIVRDFGKVMHTLLYLKWITNKNLLYKHMELCSVLCGSLYGSGVWGRRDTCICVAESLPCSLETTTTLLIGYISIHNKKFKDWEKTKREK